jgi:hypothetical protein
MVLAPRRQSTWSSTGEGLDLGGWGWWCLWQFWLTYCMLFG